LVNPVSSKDPDLKKASAVSSIFNQVAGPDLQQAWILFNIKLINYVKATVLGILCYIYV